MSGPSATGARSIVLVVDDSPSTLGLLTDALDAGGFTVLVAISGRAALELVERAVPDIVLMDALMPGLDGFETCRRMKLIPGLAGVPIVFMTGLTDTEDVIRGLEAGGVDYVVKPVSPDEVIARIRVHLATARRASSAHVALDAAGRFLLAARGDGEILWCTPQAARLLEQASGGACLTLPDEVVALIGRCSDGAAHAAANMTVLAAWPGSDATVQASYVGQVAADEHMLRLAGVRAATAEAALLRERFGLTQREAQVLLWVSRGKSSRDIGVILHLSPRTVSKHLELIFGKLGVENRASATFLAVSTLQ